MSEPEEGRRVTSNEDLRPFACKQSELATNEFRTEQYMRDIVPSEARPQVTYILLSHVNVTLKRYRDSSLANTKFSMRSSVLRLVKFQAYRYRHTLTRLSLVTSVALSSDSKAETDRLEEICSSSASALCRCSCAFEPVDCRDVSFAWRLDFEFSRRTNMLLRKNTTQLVAYSDRQNDLLEGTQRGCHQQLYR